MSVHGQAVYASGQERAVRLWIADGFWGLGQQKTGNALNVTRFLELVRLSFDGCSASVTVLTSCRDRLR
jgi:hypothetical protein